MDQGKNSDINWNTKSGIVSWSRGTYLKSCRRRSTYTTFRHTWKWAEKPVVHELSNWKEVRTDSFSILDMEKFSIDTLFWQWVIKKVQWGQEREHILHHQQKVVEQRLLSSVQMSDEECILPAKHKNNQIRWQHDKRPSRFVIGWVHTCRLRWCFRPSICCNRLIQPKSGCLIYIAETHSETKVDDSDEENFWNGLNMHTSYEINYTKY